MDSLEKLLNRWSQDTEFIDRSENWFSNAPVAASFVEIQPANMHPLLVQALRQFNISRLYSHQYQSFITAKESQNFIITTGTASGKSLCYNLPVLDNLLNYPWSTALFLFPTKALSQDQVKNVNLLINQLNQLGADLPEAVIYDGDTPMHRRSQIRKNARILISNPDMLHLGILPHHTNWDTFFKNLSFVVIDEAHYYRGIFGSHVCNLIRRLKRITAFYSGNPHFILTSATISNPESFAEKLIETPVKLISDDGSPRGARHFVVYNPPFIEPRLGIRRSAYVDTLHLARDLMDAGLQSIIFARSRPAVEKLVYDLRNSLNISREKIRGYRSGYLASERREIEQGLKNGDVQIVVATNALELGIDIGEMKAAILVGYPGSIASLKQQSGRAGRKANASIAIMVATAGAIDQYLARHPEYLNNPPEHALIDPDNLIILLHHLRCAAFELPFAKEAEFGSLSKDMLGQLLDILSSAGDLSRGEQKYFWTSNSYPADSVSLRSASPEIITLHSIEDNRMRPIGEIDPHSAYWMTHPQAIYLHDGLMYRVDNLDLKEKMAYLSP
ncbi:MAG: DEAD/DEAH box helicase, partial [Anaerolineae bacterium]|nr:DEAD/DEAH box helicase [Anaerolineae bacterium]